MHKRCVKRKNIVDDSCPNVDDDSSHGSDHGGWDGDWGPDREGEGQCYGDSCTVCEPGKVSFI